jgi:helix-loop-helix DNA-binding protein
MQSACLSMGRKRTRLDQLNDAFGQLRELVEQHVQRRVVFSQDLKPASKRGSAAENSGI